MINPVNHPVCLFFRALVKIKCRFFFWCQGFRILGRHALPRKRRAGILVANHAAFIDSVYFIAALRPRFVICGAKAKYFEKPVVRHLFQLANILKVVDKEQYMADCAALLSKGELLLIYPEMGRFPEALGEFKTWAAELALQCRVPVIPCYLYGTTYGQSGKKRLLVGDEIQPSGDAIALTNIFREAILRLKSVTDGV